MQLIGAILPPGSSPLTRGKRAPRAARPLEVRLIPAHAGKTRSMRAVSRGRRAHPRSRGENGTRVRRPHAEAGSSPLTRGKRARLSAGLTGSGLIPAHAGKTTRPTPSQSKPGAHPRSRGENERTDPARTPKPGSSPLTRGKPLKKKHNRTTNGLIPAHAGKTEAGRGGRA